MNKRDKLLQRFCKLTVQANRYHYSAPIGTIIALESVPKDIMVSCLNPLPETPYRFRYRKEVKLTGTCHIEITKMNEITKRTERNYQKLIRNNGLLWNKN